LLAKTVLRRLPGEMLVIFSQRVSSLIQTSFDVVIIAELEIGQGGHLQC